MRRAYGLTIDRREAAALERILARCESTALEPVVCVVPSGSAAGVASVPAASGRCAGALRRQWERQHYVPGGEEAWDCAGAAVAPGVPIHAGRRHGQLCSCVSGSY